MRALLHGGPNDGKSIHVGEQPEKIVGAGQTNGVYELAGISDGVAHYQWREVE